MRCVRGISGSSSAARKIACVAAMRRMATISLHMLKKKRKYEYATPIKKHKEFEAFSGEAQPA